MPRSRRMPYLTDESKRALGAAVESIEAQSAAEVVIAVRAQSGVALVADLLAACLGALLTLAFLLFSAHTFSLPAILLDTALFGALSALLSSRLPALRHLLLPRDLARSSVRHAARALFFDEGISETRGRTGILIYVSQTERLAEVLADSGVRRAMDATLWDARVREIQRVVAIERNGIALATAITALGEPLSLCLPRPHDDIDELPNEVRAR